MHKYIEVDCARFQVRPYNGGIRITLAATIRTNLEGHGGTRVQLLNPQVLREQEATYAQLFKSQVVQPPPPPHPESSREV
jgi:hypothetical protein